MPEVATTRNRNRWIIVILIFTLLLVLVFVARISTRDDEGELKIVPVEQEGDPIRNFSG